MPEGEDNPLLVWKRDRLASRSTASAFTVLPVSDSKGQADNSNPSAIREPDLRG